MTSNTARVGDQAGGLGAAEPSETGARFTVENTYLNTSSFSFRARQRRFRLIQPLIEKIIAEKGHCRIADIGGTEYYWEIARDFLASQPVEIHLMNLEKAPVRGAKFTSHAANACDLSAFADNSFDMVHSNSVIEHVGRWGAQVAMAREVARLAPVYYVQTPNFWFPLEPHFRFPAFQFLPEQIRYRLLMWFNLGFGGRRETLDEAIRAVQSAELLEMAQMKVLFPDARFERERIAFLTKSLIAIRD